jgi:hypothetical protein
LARRPRQLIPRPPLQSAQIAAAAYLGSAEHKSQRWWGGLPQARVGEDGIATRPKKQRTTVCPLVAEADRHQATLWVRAALSAGQYRYLEADKDFPGRIWYCQAQTGQLWMGYCINTVKGEYKGWPIEKDDYIAVFG